MKYVDEFRNKNLVQKAAENIRAIAPEKNINIMEVCGTHTQSFFRFGLDKMLPSQLRLIAGPGCPVCVSSQKYIDDAIKLASHKDAIVLTFGDMLRIPGTRSTLEKEKAKFGNVRVVYSAFDSLKVARLNLDKKIVFLAVGFETTAPTIALTILAAKKQNLKNLFFYSSLKLIPPAMRHLLQDRRLNLDGFLCPGHVSAIIGTKSYEFIPKRYKIGCCVAGFEPLDILEGLYLLLQQIVKNKPAVENQYARVVTKQGNPKAQKVIEQVFEISDSHWRGFGNIPKSGLKIRNEFSEFDAQKLFRLDSELRAQSLELKTKCRCADVLKGLISPPECPLFLRACTPDNPVGPCMVSSEGACNAYYKYKR
jgi:hydrogenase expression/formation protein HypD